eukprot:6038322-Pyramimonas_sp.AAC.1
MGSLKEDIVEDEEAGGTIILILYDGEDYEETKIRMRGSRTSRRANMGETEGKQEQEDQGQKEDEEEGRDRERLMRGGMERTRL